MFRVQKWLFHCKVKRIVMGSKLTDSVQRAFAVLEAFGPASPTMTLQEVAEKIGLPKVTAFRYLRTLVSLGYVSRPAGSNGYTLSPKVLHLGFTALGGMELRQVALPYLQDLAGLAGQNIGLGVVDKREVVYVERIKRRRIINVDYGVGSRVSIYRTAIGRAILAFMSDAEVTDIVREILKDEEAAEFVGQEGGKLLTMLQEVRREGYAANNLGFIPGLRAIGAPLFDGRGIVEGAINMTVISMEISMEELTGKYAPLLLTTAENISSARGFKKEKVTDA
jgi:IclR family transcriptional regulator, pca regulon regulatory protein